MATTNHRAVPTVLLVVAMALVAAQAAAEASAGSARGRSHGATTTDLALPLATRVHCTGVHVVRPGETCASVARAAQMTVAQFMQLNQNITCAALYHGQWVCVRGTAIGA